MTWERPLPFPWSTHQTPRGLFLVVGVHHLQLVEVHRHPNHSRSARQANPHSRSRQSHSPRGCSSSRSHTRRRGRQRCSHLQTSSPLQRSSFRHLLGILHSVTSFHGPSCGEPCATSRFWLHRTSSCLHGPATVCRPGISVPTLSSWSRGRSLRHCWGPGHCGWSLRQGSAATARSIRGLTFCSFWTRRTSPRLVLPEAGQLRRMQLGVLSSRLALLKEWHAVWFVLT